MKNKLISLYLIMVVSVISLISGCHGRHYLMQREEFYLTINAENLPEKMTAVTFVLDPALDLAEGGDGAIAWDAVMWDKQGNEEFNLAINLDQFLGETKALLITIPKPLSEVENNYLGVFNHGGKKIYNHLGQFKELAHPGKKIKPEEYKDFLPSLNADAPYVEEVVKGSEHYDDLIKLYKNFRLNEVKLTRTYLYKKYPYLLKYGASSKLLKEQLEKIAREDSLVMGFKKWAGEGWFIYLAYPFMGVEGTAITVAVAKVITLPSIWGDKINKPGYGEYIGDADYTARMIVRSFAYTKRMIELNKGASESDRETELPQELKEQLRERYNRDFSTYEEYNRWAVKERGRQ